MSSSRIFLTCIGYFLLVAGNSGEALAKPAEKPNEKQIEKQLKPTAGALDIVAVVGDKAISSFDLSSRIKFIIATTRISNTPDVIANIKPQVIRTLIDETLQLHEATKNGINVDEKEIDQAIANIESQRGMPAGAIGTMLAANNVPVKTFRDQIRAQIAWGKMLGKTVRSRIKISDDEVAMAQGRIPIATENKTDVAVDIKEVEIAVINLAVDKPQRIAEVKKLGDRLYSELLKGASFEDVARQFSASGDAKPFWIRPEQLDKNVVQVLRNTKQGAITPPILSNTGFTIIKLVNIRANKTEAKVEKAKPKQLATGKDFEISLKEIFLKIKPNVSVKEADILLQIGESVAKNPGTCEEKGIAGMDGLADFDIDVTMKKAPSAELPQALRAATENLKIGEVSNPFASPEGIRLYMLCGKKEIDVTSSANLDKVRDYLFRQKFDLEAQKYLRNLRRETFIEVRG